MVGSRNVVSRIALIVVLVQWKLCKRGSLGEPEKGTPADGVVVSPLHR